MTLHDRLRYVSNAVMNFKVLDDEGELDGVHALIAVVTIIIMIGIGGAIQ
ncbi:hypothetical protein [Carnobacterium jeotgali]